jgi:hypothetical protein
VKVGWWSLAVSVVLVSVGIGCVVLGQRGRAAAETTTDLLSLDYDRAAAADARTGLFARYGDALARVAGLDTNTLDQRLSADYWRGDYTALLSGSATPGSSSEDARPLLVTANAAFRSIRFDAGQSEVVAQLQTVLGQYAAILKDDSLNFDAAYNYEFVAMTRDRILRAPRGGPSVFAPHHASDQTLHGEPGFEAPGLERNDFEVITPHESEERREEQEAGKNTTRVRKG